MNDVIVCGTDFSPEAASALGWAAAIARRDGASIDLVHVVQGQHEGMPARLPEAAGEAARELDVSVRPQLLHGHAHEELLRHAREAGASMVVLGASGLASVERWMMGSVADRTARSADRPVVLVPKSADRDAWPSREATKGARPPRVVAGLGTGNDEDLTRFVSSLRRAGPVDVTFVHLYWPVGEYERLGLQGPRDLFAADADVVKNLEPALRAKIAGVAGQGVIELEVRPAWGEPASNLLAAVEERDADLLVVGAHERHGLARLIGGSTARRLARQSRHVPIAVVPSVAPARAAGIPLVRTVLAATDLSPQSNAAVAHAYALLRGTGGVVELCHIHEHGLPSPAYAYARPELGDVERARLASELRGLIPADAKDMGIATHVTIVDGGKAAEAIVQAAERLHADVISLASHGRGGIARAVVGSVAEEVLRLARRPVFVVRD